MKWTFAVPVALSAAATIATHAAAPADDPLPAGAAVRLGTARFRHGIPISALAVSTDGRTAVAVNGNHMLGATRVFDLVTGRGRYALAGWEGTSIEAAALSPDGRTLVTKQDFSLRVRDAATGKELRKIDLPRASQYSRNEWLAFTPDGESVLVTSQGAVVHMIDVRTGRTIREFSNDNPESKLGAGFTGVLGIAVSADGKRLATGGFANDRDNYFARLWDVETGKELRRFMHGQSYGIESLAFSADGKTLATGAHDARLRLFDVDTGRLIKAFPPDGPSRMHGGCVAFAPDGKTVAAAGNALRVYDVASFEERWHTDRKALGLVFTDGGKTLTAAVSGSICRWDAAAGKLLTPVGGDGPVEQILVSRDGRRAVSRGTDGDVHVWDLTTGRHVRGVTAAWQRGLAMSPDGRFLVWPIEDESLRFTEPDRPNVAFYGNRLHVYDVDADRTIDRFPSFKGDANDLAFADAGRKVVTVDHRDAAVRVWDFATGKEERTFHARRADEKALTNPVWRAAVSRDGKHVAVAYVFREGGNVDRLGLGNRETYPIRVWDVATGIERHEFDARARYVHHLVFSPDGRWLASSGSAFDPPGAGGQLAVWNVLAGTTAATLPTTAAAVAFSDDGRYLASATPDGDVRLWETATWTQRARFADGHGDRTTVLAFSPTRPLVLSGSLDTTIVGWDFRIPPGARAPAEPLDSAWARLATRDATQVLEAQGKFLADPARAVKFLGEKIQPVPAADPAQIRQLIEQLNSPEYPVRESASKALRELRAHAVPHLEAATATAPSAETRTRLTSILHAIAIQEHPPTPNQLQQIRAVHVLELLATPDAKALLAKWSTGRPGHPLTDHAAGALERLGTTTPP